MRKRSTGFLVVLLISVSLSLLACTGEQRSRDGGNVETIRASLLVLVENGDARWFRDVEVPEGTDAFELTQIVTGGEMKATFYPQFRSHFVEAIFSTENKAPNFWLIWLWNDIESKWELLPVAADLFSPKEGHVLAWYYADTTRENNPPPGAP